MELRLSVSYTRLYIAGIKPSGGIVYLYTVLAHYLQMTLREYNTLGQAPFDPTLPPHFLHTHN